jgi:hypothetical protein
MHGNALVSHLLRKTISFVAKATEYELQDHTR